MKKIQFFIILLTTIFLTLSCTKDELETSNEINQENTSVPILYKNEIVTPRSGFVDVIFYRTSLTTDNYLLSQNNNYFRTYNLYNRNRIDSINFVVTGKGLINVAGVLLKHYNITIFYKDKTPPTTFTAFSKSSADKFNYNPINSAFVLSNSNLANVMTFEIQKSSATRYNYWQDKTVVANFVKISKNGVRCDLRVLDPLNKDSNIFILPHNH